jgi:prepilin-type N-terminal cleavage/methylation domain-containing protein
MALLHFAKRRRNYGQSRGFTLVELLTVVAITGVLATIAVFLVRKHFQEAKTLDAMSVVQAIRGGQESHRSENGAYLDCSSTSGLWYPATPDGKTRSWVPSTHADLACWRQLGISASTSTQFGFKTFAGSTGTISAVLDVASPPTWPAATDPWYIIEAGGDRDQDGQFSYLLAASLNGEVYVENDTE